MRCLRMRFLSDAAFWRWTFWAFILSISGSKLNAQNQTPQEILDWITQNEGEYEFEGNNSESPIVVLNLDRSRRRDLGFEMERIKDEDLKRLEFMPHLREINFANLRSFSDQGLLHLASLRHLTKLNLSGTWISGSTFGSLAHLPLLREISLNHCGMVGDETAKSLTQFQNLTKLQLDGSSNAWMSESGWREQLRSDFDYRSSRPTNTSRLNMYRGGITNVGLEHISELHELRHLSAMNTLIDDDGLAVLPKLAHLTHLDLSGASITDAGLVSIGRLGQLQTLKLNRTPISDKGLESLSRLTELNELELRCTLLTSTGLRHLQACTKLRKLDLGNTGIANAAIDVLLGMPQLEELNLKDTGVPLSALIKLSKANKSLSLKKLMMASSFADGGFASKTPTEEIKHLVLSISADLDLFQSRARKGIKDPPTVQDVDLSYLRQNLKLDRLESLELNNTQVTDAGMIHLRDLVELKRLYLNKTSVTDAGLVHLQELTSLQSLPIRDTQITLRGVVNLVVVLQHGTLLEALKIAGVVRQRASDTSQLFLDLQGVRASDSDLETIARLGEIDSLFLQNNPISDAGVAHLTRLSDLRRLWISGHDITGLSAESLRLLSKLECLWLTDTKFTDKDLVGLADLKSLRILNLSGMSFTQQGIDNLKALKSLERLIVDTSSLTKDEIRQLQSNNPKLNIVRSQKKALAAIREHERIEPVLPQGYHRVLEMGRARTVVPEIPDIAVFGDAHFEQAETLNCEIDCGSSLENWKNLPTLKSVSLIGVKQPSLAISKLKDMPSVKEISLYRSGVKDADLAEFENMTQLTKLDLSETPCTMFALTHLRKLSNLESLSLSGYGTDVRDEGLDNLAKFPNLQKLTLDFTLITDAGMVHLRRLKKLVQLGLRGVLIDEGLQHLSELQNLQELDLYATVVTDDSLAHLTNLKNLKRISLEDTFVSEEGIKRLREHLPNTEVDAGFISEEQRRSSRPFGKLRIPTYRSSKDEVYMVDLRNCKDLAEVMPHVLKQTGLRSVQLGALATERLLDDIVQISSLETLNLSKSQLTAVGIKKLHSLKRLNTLNLNGCTLDDKALMSLQELPELQNLWLTGAVLPARASQLQNLIKLKALSLSETGIVDHDLRHLAGMTQLRQLYLDQNPISVAGLAHLKDLDSLELLSVNETDIDEQVVHEFQVSHPNCKEIRFTKR